MKIQLLVAALLATFISSGTSTISIVGADNVNDIGESNEDPLALQQPQDESFAACILVMDDNHRLIEWLAYHYHTMPLRRLIVMTDPRSKTSPLPVLDRWEKYMKIDLWSDNDLFTVEELKNRTDVDMIKNHRSRQKAFNVKCLTTLKDEGAKWTLMTDVDEYLHINPRAWDSSEHLYQTDIAPMHLSEPGSVLKMLNKVDLNDERLHAQEWKACLPVSRVQLSGTESTDEEVNNRFPKEFEPTILAKDFDTFRWRYSGVDTITARDGVIPGKTLIDVSSIPESEMWRLIGDPHRPIDKLCNGGNAWLNTNETMFVANHILGTLESFAARDDSRFIDRVLTWEQRKEVGGIENLTDELRPWLSGFADTMGIGESRRLLANVGQLQSQTHDTPRCSINFFGLPRSFKTMALPSIVKNILLPNARYNCDIVVHYYDIQFDESGRFNRGGEIDADAVHALEEVTKVIAANAGKSPPSVLIKSETKEEFDEKYGDLVNKYKTARDVNTGELKYFPWKEKSYSAATKVIDNIVMQWNSIQSAWQLMEERSKVHGFEYKRVAFFRTDAFYALPVDIFQVDKDTFDYNNRYAVIPAFARYPVNDRMMYGPFEAVKIWATERFQRLEHYIESCEIKGYGMHQEQYIGNGILPAIREETGYEIIENIDICFYRTRAADSVLITDCSDPKGGSVRGIQEIDQVKLVQELVHRDCLEVPIGRFIELRCDESSMQAAARRLGSSVSPSFLPTLPPQPAPKPPPPAPKPTPPAPTPPPTDVVTSAPSPPLPTLQPTVRPEKIVSTVEVSGTCDCDSPAATKVADELSETPTVPGADIVEVDVTCTPNCASGDVSRGAGDSVVFSVDYFYFEDKSSSVPFNQEVALSEIGESIAVIVEQVAEDTGIELVLAPIVVTNDDDTSFSSILPFDSTSRKFCLQVMNFRVNSVFKMRPCEKKEGNRRQKQLWSFDNSGQLRNRDRPEWCMTWAGGKQKDLRLGLCDNSTRKTARFNYDETDKALIVRNLYNGKKFKIGFNTETKYEQLRLYGLNSENLSVNSFLLLTS